jgi:hypothetical protein
MIYTIVQSRDGFFHLFYLDPKTKQHKFCIKAESPYVAQEAFETVFPFSKIHSVESYWQIWHYWFKRRRMHAYFGRHRTV